nr:hypothetical protein [Allgaiera sp.]
MTDMLTKGAPVPASIGRCADLLRDVQDLRIVMEKQVAEIKARETELREHIIENLPKEGPDSVAKGLRYKASINEKEHFSVTDWPEVYAFIRQNNRFDMLKKDLKE